MAGSHAGLEERLVGRGEVLDELWRAIGEGRRVVLEGPAGIGKTDVVRTLVGLAREQGSTVAACAPTEAEQLLPYAALADLVDPLLPLLPALPEPQAAALTAVATSGGPVEERTVAAATRSLLDLAAAGEQPVLVVVDDEPCLDDSSRRALEYALRRVAVPTLLTRRTDGAPEDLPLGLAAAVVGEPPHVVTLGPMGVAALRHLLDHRLGRSLPRHLAARIAHEADGNPLLAVELGRAVLRLPHLPLPTEDLPVVGGSVLELASGVLRDLPGRTLTALRLAALLSVPRAVDLAAAGVTSEAFAPAEDAGLVRVDGTGVRFTHPVYAAAVRASVTPAERRRLHGVLAGAVADPDERARQLARAHVDPDEAVAAELAGAAARQRRLGAPGVAAGLYLRAAELTPPAEAVVIERRLMVAQCQFEAGLYSAADASATALDTAAGGADPETAAEALLLRARIAWADNASTADAVALATQALVRVPSESVLAGRVHAYLAVFVDAAELGAHHAAEAVRLLTASETDDLLLAAALLMRFFHDTRRGLPADTALLDRALELAAGRVLDLADTVPSLWWAAIDDHGRAREHLDGLLEHARVHGDEPAEHETLIHLAITELRAGRFAVARSHVDEASRLGQHLGTGQLEEQWIDGLIAASVGDLPGAQARLAQLRSATEAAEPWARRIALDLAGFVDLLAGRAEAACAAFAELSTLIDDAGLAESWPMRHEPSWVEAALSCGDHAAARSALSRLEARHARLPRPWTALGVARSRVLLAAAGGTDTTAALADLEEALAGVPADVVPFERGRCLLIAGMTHRRARRKAAAKELLTRAADLFDGLGAAGMAQRAREELGRIGGRPAASATELTETERRVAELAAAGGANQEIADQLYLSPKTVEANLSRAYRKLGISRRTELAGALGATVSQTSR